ncbi:unnamed protein product [Sphagnum balticum]
MPMETNASLAISRGVLTAMVVVNAQSATMDTNSTLNIPNVLAATSITATTANKMTSAPNAQTCSLQTEVEDVLSVSPLAIPVTEMAHVQLVNIPTLKDKSPKVSIAISVKTTGASLVLQTIPVFALPAKKDSSPTVKDNAQQDVLKNNAIPAMTKIILSASAASLSTMWNLQVVSAFNVPTLLNAPLVTPIHPATALNAIKDFTSAPTHANRAQAIAKPALLRLVVILLPTLTDRPS